MWQLSVFVPAVATLLYKLNELRKEEEKKNQSKPRITDIIIYPIKSCRGISLKTGKINELGFEYDRLWMVVDAQTKRFVTQRQIPKMATIVPYFSGDYLCIDAPGMPTLKFLLQTTKRADVAVHVWDDTVNAIDMGNDISSWFSSFLEREVRLVRVDEKVKRIADANYWTEKIPGPKQVSFADGFPFLLFSKESLDFVNNSITKEKLTKSRFRPNIVVEGAKEPFDEDNWKTFHIRGVTFHSIKLCERCKITTIDPETGVVIPGNEPLNTLPKIRNLKNAIFGQNVSHETPGYVCVGDYVDIEAN